MSDPRNHVSWAAGVDAYLRGDPLPPGESLDFEGGYRWAEQVYRRDWWAVAVALSITAILLMAGIGAISIAWWLA